ncbi:MAG: LamG domain-containing protein [Deltaproteobacteria bacterium]|nr:LamG domain-containing protein [Deltaproteobacteria bacterium]
MSNKMFTAIFALVVIATSVWYTNVVEAQIVVTDGLVSFWTFDKSDIDSKTVKDVFGSNHGTIKGKPKSVEGKIEEAMEFDGAGDFIDCGNDASLDLTDAITIEVWIKPESAGEGGPNAGPICKAEAGVDPWSWQLRYNAPGSFMGFQFNANPGGSTWISVQERLSAGKWYHIAGTFDGNNIICYLDGVEKQKGKIAAISGGAGRFFIGQDGWVNVFNGVIDEVRIYNRALSEAEIQQNYKSTLQLAVEPSNKLAITWGSVKVKD